MNELLTDEEKLRLAEIAMLQAENELLRKRNEALRGALNRKRGPEGEMEEKVAEWLRGRGYTVNAPSAL